MTPQEPERLRPARLRDARQAAEVADGGLVEVQQALAGGVVDETLGLEYEPAAASGLQPLAA